MGRFPITAEMYLGATLGWADVTADVRLSTATSGGGITVTRGKADQGSQADPGQCSLTLNNRHGKWSPRNPRSPYYGLIGRNTPIRVGVGMFADTFTRTVAGGMGTADSGQSWSLAGAADWSVSGGKGVLAFASVGIARTGVLSTAVVVDADQVVDVAASALMTGASLVAGTVARYTSGSNYYWLRAEFDVGGTMTVKIDKVVGGVSTELGITRPVPGATYGAGTPMRVRTSVVGSRLSIKVWPAASPEPRDWHLSVNDSSLRDAGNVGLRHWLVGGNTNSPTPTVSMDNYLVTLPRFSGEISSWPARWDISGKDRWVPVEASGILRRLGQGRKPVNSPIFGLLNQYAPTGYLPLEDGQDSTAAANVIPNGTAGVVTDVSFAADDSLPGAATAAHLNSVNSTIVLTNRPQSGSTSWTFACFFKLDALPPGADVTLLRLKSSGTVTDWTFMVSNVGYRWLGTNSGGGTVFDKASLHNAPPTNWVAMVVSATQAGGNVQVNIWWYGIGSLVFTTVPSFTYSGTVGSASTATVGPSSILPGALGHMAFFGPTAPGITAAFAPAANGYIGEPAGERMLRLAREQGVPFGMTGSPGDTELMGRQGVDTFLDLLALCAAVDGGILGESRGGLLPSYRTRVSLYNQTPVALSYAAEHISEPFEPVDDDDAIRNDVTVTRVGGSSSRAVQESGPVSVLPAPDGVGIYDESVTLNMATDAQTPNQAGWRLHLGTVDDARYPRARINLASPAWAGDQLLTRRAAAVDSGDVVSIGDLPDWLPPGPAELMIQGYTEVLDAYVWTITWNAAPASPWDVATADGEQRVPADGSTLAMGITDTDRTWAISSTAENGPWSVDPIDYPLDVRIGGEHVRADAPGWSLNSNPFMTGNANGWTGAAATLAYSATGRPDTPHGVCVITPDGVTAVGGANSNPTAVSASTSYRFIMWARADVSPISVTIAADWQTAGNTFISSSFSSVVPLATADGWTPIVVTFSSPATAAFVVLRARHQGTPAVTAKWRFTEFSVSDAATATGVGAFQRLSCAPGGRGINGVQRAWPSGTEVDVWQPAIAPL